MKMRKTTKMWFLSAMATLTALCGTVALQNEQQPVSAAAGFTMEMIDGASVRLVGTDATTYGIKYTAKIAKDSYNENAKYYVMIIPTGWLTKYNLTEGCDYYDILVNQNGKDPSFDNPAARTINIMEATPKLDGDYYYFNGSITDVKYENSFRDFFGVAYMEVNDVRTYAGFETGENVRSVSQVASAALNDKTNNWTTDEKASLTAMVQKAYNAKNDDDYTTVENVALPTISAESVSIALEKGKTYQLSAPTGIPANLGVDVEWSANNDCVTVDENGLLTIAKTGEATVTATVLGEDYEVASVSSKDYFLVNFDIEDSKNNAVECVGTALYTDGNSVGHTFETDWHETYEGRNGVLQTMTTAGGNYGFGKVKVAFNKTTAEMAALEFDYISVWAWVDIDGTYDVRSQNLYLETGLQGKTWQEIRIYAEDIAATSPNSYWAHNFGVANARDRFNKAYSSDSYANWSNINELFSIKLANGAEPVDVYIDSVYYSDFNVVVNEYEEPNQTGTFALPTVKVTNRENVVMTKDYNVRVQKLWDGSELPIENGEVTLPYSGAEYAVNYTFSYNGLDIYHTLNITIERESLATEVLEDFNSPSSAQNVRVGNNTSATKNATWLESFTKGSTTKTGVVVITVGGADGQYLWLNFAKTLTELQAISDDDWDYILIDMCMIRADGKTDWTSFSSWSQTFGVSPGYWTTRKLTKEIIMGSNGNNSWWSKEAGAKDATAIDKFYEIHSAEGTGKYFGALSVEATIYIDEIKFVKEA